MRIAIASDIHLEFGSNPDLLTDAHVIVLAGDIFVPARLELNEPFQNLLSTCVEHYEKVFYLMGNHEHYGGDFNTTEDIVREVIGDIDVEFLSDSAYTHNEVQFLGGTLWTSCNDRDPGTMELVGRSMNDYRQTKNFNPEVSVESHERTIEFLEATMEEGAVVCTHHAPSLESVPPFFRDEGRINHAYYSELAPLILDKKPALWLHGHTHDTRDYMVGDTRVVCNPHGYERYEKRAEEFEIQVIEI